MAITCDLSIPVPVYVEKYLNQRYGPNYKLSKNSSLGLLVIEICTTRRYLKPVRKRDTNGAFVMQVTEAYYKKKAYNVTAKKLKFLTELLVKLFYEEMVEAVSRQVQQNDKDGKAALGAFLEYYNITENDLKFESAYMQYRRKKKPLLKN